MNGAKWYHSSLSRALTNAVDEIRACIDAHSNSYAASVAVFEQVRDMALEDVDRSRELAEVEERQRIRAERNISADMPVEFSADFIDRRDALDQQARDAATARCAEEVAKLKVEFPMANYEDDGADPQPLGNVLWRLQLLWRQHLEQLTSSNADRTQRCDTSARIRRLQKNGGGDLPASAVAAAAAPPNTQPAIAAPLGLPAGPFVQMHAIETPLDLLVLGGSKDHFGEGVSSDDLYFEEAPQLDWISGLDSVAAVTFVEMCLASTVRKRGREAVQCHEAALRPALELAKRRIAQPDRDDAVSRASVQRSRVEPSTARPRSAPPRHKEVEASSIDISHVRIVNMVKEAQPGVDEDGELSAEQPVLEQKFPYIRDANAPGASELNIDRDEEGGDEPQRRRHRDDDLSAYLWDERVAEEAGNVATLRATVVIPRSWSRREAVTRGANSLHSVLARIIVPPPQQVGGDGERASNMQTDRLRLPRTFRHGILSLGHAGEAFVAEAKLTQGN